MGELSFGRLAFFLRGVVYWAIELSDFPNFAVAFFPVSR
jgi:hypothetical protein